MKTDDFIRALAADRTLGAEPGRGLVLAVAAGFAATAIMFMLVFGIRGDVAAALQTVWFPFKFVVMIALVAAAVHLAIVLARPGADPAAAARLLAVPAVLIGAAVVIELTSVPASGWRPLLVGNNATVCLIAIPLIAVVPLVAILVALRRAAPTAPVLAGSAAGLLAAALAATLYAAHCVDDSPLFVLTWYSLAIAVVVAAGALLGSRVLRW